MKNIYLVGSSVLAILMTGCLQPGGSARVSDNSNKSKTPSYNQYLNQSNWNTDSGNSSGSSSSSSSGSDDSSSSVGRSELPPMEFAVEATGYSTTESFSINVRARKILRIRFSPLVQMSQVKDSGFSPLYSALGVYVGVGADQRATSLLDNGVYSGRREQSAIMDFSAKIPNDCSASDATCRVSVKIVINRPNYNYYCLNGMGGCPWDRVHPNHPWNGTLWVETDDTQPLK